MTRHHGLSKEATQRLLDLGVDDNLIKLETKIGTKGNKNGIEERAYRLPTHDMLPKERYDWYVKYRISEWAEFQVWKFLHLQTLAHGKKSLPPKGRRLFIPRLILR